MEEARLARPPVTEHAHGDGQQPWLSEHHLEAVNEVVEAEEINPRLVISPHGLPPFRSGGFEPRGATAGRAGSRAMLARNGQPLGRAGETSLRGYSSARAGSRQRHRGRARASRPRRDSVRPCPPTSSSSRAACPGAQAAGAEHGGAPSCRCSSITLERWRQTRVLALGRPACRQWLGGAEVPGALRGPPGEAFARGCTVARPLPLVADQVDQRWPGKRTDWQGPVATNGQRVCQGSAPAASQVRSSSRYTSSSPSPRFV